MQKRTLGNSGLEVSAIGLGCNPFGNEVDASTAEAIVKASMDVGITYFDTADSYFEGRSVADIATRFRIPEGTVKSRLHYGLRTLKLILQENGVTRP